MKTQLPSDARRQLDSTLQSESIGRSAGRIAARSLRRVGPLDSIFRCYKLWDGYPSLNRLSKFMFHQLIGIGMNHVALIQVNAGAEVTPIRAFLVPVILGLSFLGLALHVTAAQIEDIPVVRGVWNPENDLIALMNFLPSQNTIEILTGSLEHIVSLHVDELPDGITQVDSHEVAWSPSGDKLAAVFYATDNIIQDYTYVIVWSVETWVETLRLTDQGTKISWSPTGEYFTTGLQVFEFVTGKVVSETERDGPFNFIAWHPTNENQLLLGYDEEIVIINPWTGQSLYAYSYGLPPIKWSNSFPNG